MPGRRHRHHQQSHNGSSSSSSSSNRRRRRRSQVPTCCWTKTAHARSSSHLSVLQHSHLSKPDSASPLQATLVSVRGPATSTAHGSEPARTKRTVHARMPALGWIPMMFAKGRQRPLQGLESEQSESSVWSAIAVTAREASKPDQANGLRQVPVQTQVQV